MKTDQAQKITPEVEAWARGAVAASFEAQPFVPLHDSVPTPEFPITSRADIVRYAGFLRWAGAPEKVIFGELMKSYGTGAIDQADPARPWTKQDFSQIARDFGRKPMGDHSLPPDPFSAVPHEAITRRPPPFTSTPDAQRRAAGRVGRLLLPVVRRTEAT
jgi:hypothetical protein